MSEYDHCMTPVFRTSHSPLRNSISFPIGPIVSQELSSVGSANITDRSGVRVNGVFVNQSTTSDSGKNNCDDLREQVRDLGNSVKEQFNGLHEALSSSFATLEKQVKDQDERLKQCYSDSAAYVQKLGESVHSRFDELHEKLASSFTVLEVQSLRNRGLLEEYHLDYASGLEQISEDLQCVKEALKLILVELFEKKRSTKKRRKNGPDETGRRSVLTAPSESSSVGAENLSKSQDQSCQIDTPEKHSLSVDATAKTDRDDISDSAGDFAEIREPPPENQAHVSADHGLQELAERAEGTEVQPEVGPGDGSLDCDEVQARLDSLGYRISQWQVQVLMEKFAITCKSRPIRLTDTEFNQLLESLSESSKNEEVRKLRRGSHNFGSFDEDQVVQKREKSALSQWINISLGSDPDLQGLLPLDPNGVTLCDKIQDGIVLCKLVKHFFPEAINDKAINKNATNPYKKLENLTLALKTAQTIGCNVSNITANDLLRGKPDAVLDFIWQITRLGLLCPLKSEECSDLVELLEEDEKLEHLQVLPPEAVLLRWVNYHLKQGGCRRTCTNFGSDIRDSEIYAFLLRQIAPRSAVNIVRQVMLEKDLWKRAELVLNVADKLDCRLFVTTDDVVMGYSKLNLTFVAHLFNRHPGFDTETPEDAEEPLATDDFEETDEEEDILSWINLLGVHPPVQRLYTDLTDGQIILQLLDLIAPGIVDWTRVNKKFIGIGDVYKKLQNCNYALEIAKQLKVSVGGISGQNLANGEPKSTLAFLLRLRKAHELFKRSQSVDSGEPDQDKGIVSCVNKTLLATRNQHQKEFSRSFSC